MLAIIPMINPSGNRSPIKIADTIFKVMLQVEIRLYQNGVSLSRPKIRVLKKNEIENPTADKAVRIRKLLNNFFNLCLIEQTRNVVLTENTKNIIIKGKYKVPVNWAAL